MKTDQAFLLRMICGSRSRGIRHSYGLSLALLLFALLGCSAMEPGREVVTPVPPVPPVPQFSTSIGLDFVLIPGVTVDLVMERQGPSHRVTLSPFYSARHVVTKGMYSQFLQETKHPYDRKRTGMEFADQTGAMPAFVSEEQWKALPVEYANNSSPLQAVTTLSWDEATAFARWLSKRENRSISLPTETQARWLAGGGVARVNHTFWWMEREPSSADCWIVSPFQIHISPTRGAFMPGSCAMNPLGLHLSTGSFWTLDWYQEIYRPEPAVDPQGPPSSRDGTRVLQSMWIESRGGFFPNAPFASIMLVSPIQAQDHRAWAPSPEPAVPPVPVQALPRQEVSLADGLSLALRQIPAGTMVLGRSRAERPWAYEDPQTTVHMQSYWLGETEVTQAQFRAVTGINPSRVLGDTLPVHSVTMAETLAFCDLLTLRERAAGRLGPDEEYRLPTEPEWERAVRAGGTSRWSYGDDPAVLRRYAWFDLIGQDGPKPVATRWPNAWGFYDLEGNVLERCCHHVSRYSGGELLIPWVPQTLGHANYRDFYAARGGAFNMGAIACESTIRRGVDIESRVSHLGFRVVRGVIIPEFDPQESWRRVFNRSHFQSKPEYRAIMQAQGVVLPPPPSKP